MTDGHIFISYARRDGRDYAARLDDSLQQVGFATWRDTRDIDPNQDFSAELEHAISQSSHVVCCITPDTRRDDSFVRREIGYALAVKKPVVPLVFENTLPPIHIVNVTHIKAAPHAWDQTVGELSARLRRTDDRTYEQVTLPADPYRDYLTALYDQIVRYLNLTVFSLITLRGEASPDAVEKSTTNVLPMAFFDMAGIDAEPDDQTRFNNFQEAFDKYAGRVLLLGDPGAGKTTTLFAFARDAVAARLENPALPLPILAPIATWDAKKQTPLAEWLSASIPALTRDDISHLIDAGHALLLLDGLDELGGEREDDTTKEHYDPRLRFMSQIAPITASSLVPHPSSLGTSLVLTCRIKDYADIGAKLPLTGAVTLQPLNDDQMRDYLRDVPDLWAALESDDDLREVARTPLLLSLFTFAFRELPDEAKHLHDLKHGDLRDKIFETYVKRRYEREARRPNMEMVFTLDDLYQILGKLAMENARSVWVTENVFTLEDFLRVISARIEITKLIQLVTQIHLLVARDNASFRFIHLLLRDYFAFNYSLNYLDQGNTAIRSRAATALGRLGDIRAVEALLNIVQNRSDKSAVRIDSILALGRLKAFDSFETIMRVLEDTNEHDSVRYSAAITLGKLGDLRAFKPLLAILKNEMEDVFIRFSAALALGKLGDPRVFHHLISMLTDASQDANVHAGIADALGILGNTAAVKYLISVLSHPSSIVRRSSSVALGKLRASQAIDPLVDLMFHDNEFVVQNSAYEALEQIGTPEALAAVEAWRREQAGGEE